MKRLLMAFAATGVLVSGASLAADSTIQFRRSDSALDSIHTVQYERERWDDRSGAVRDREARIDGWIRRGIDDGRINRPEARRLYRELADIRAKERSWSSDGRLDGRERAELNRDLDRLTDDVRAQMHDRDRRY